MDVDDIIRQEFTDIRGADSREVMREALLSALSLQTRLFFALNIGKHGTPQDIRQHWADTQRSVLACGQKYQEIENSK